MYQDVGNRGEKLSTVKSAVVQYGILVIMLALAAGLWRLQVLGASNFRELAEQNRIRKVPILAARGKLSVAKFRAPLGQCQRREASPPAQADNQMAVARLALRVEAGVGSQRQRVAMANFNGGSDRPDQCIGREQKPIASDQQDLTLELPVV